MALVSPWQDRHPRPSPPVGQTVTGQWDVAVVGGGLTGLTAALLLARAGKSVVVLEARSVGTGTTGGSTAKISLLQGTQLSKIAGRHPERVVQDYVRANTEGQAWLEDFCTEHGVETQRRPAYTFGFGDRGVRAARRELDTCRRAGLPVTWLDQPDLPFETRGAVTLADQLQVDPVQLLEGLAAQAQALGVQLVEGVRVEGVTGREPVRVATSAGAVEARTVVLATNMPILDRGGFFARATPARSYGLAFRTPEQAVAGMWISADGPTRSLRDAPAEDGHLLLVGGNGHTTGRGGSTTSHLDDLRAWTARHYPEAVETHAWSAQDFLPHHALPFAGPLVPGREDVLVAGGYSKWGMTNAVAAALAVTGRVAGTPPAWAGVFEPWSSPELRGLVDAFRINAEVGVAMTGGWLRPLFHPGAGDPPVEGEGRVRLDRPRLPTAVSRVEGVERKVSAVCSHLGGIVAWNDAEKSWDCPLHGSRFAPDGAVLDGPATCGLVKRPRS